MLPAAAPDEPIHRDYEARVRPGVFPVTDDIVADPALFAEAAINALRIGDPSYGVGEQVSFAGILIALGLLITLLVAQTWRQRGHVLLLAVPLTAAGYVLLTVARFR